MVVTTTTREFTFIKLKDLQAKKKKKFSLQSSRQGVELAKAMRYRPLRDRQTKVL